MEGYVELLMTEKQSPVVLRNTPVTDWPAIKKWNKDYLASKWTGMRLFVHTRNPKCVSPFTVLERLIFTSATSLFDSWYPVAAYHPYKSAEFRSIFGGLG